MTKKQLIIPTLLTALIAFMDVTGIPCAFFINIKIADITSMYFTLMANFILIGITAYIVLKYLCPYFDISLKTAGLKNGLKAHGLSALLISAAGFVAFYVGLFPFNQTPTLWKVLIEGVIYYIGVAFVEELYIRGLLLNIIESLFDKSKNKTNIAVWLSSLIFGFGHIFGVIGQSPLIIISKVVWTVCMGLYLGFVYKSSKTLWLPIIIHFLINVCALPYCFSTVGGYPNLTLCIILPAYLLLGAYSVYLMKKSKSVRILQ